jgi:sarcosine oxidase subunit gamma
VKRSPHPRAFRPGDTAITGVAHIGVQLWQADAGPAYTFSIPRSYAGSFREWLAASCAEYGLELLPTAPA